MPTAPRDFAALACIAIASLLCARAFAADCIQPAANAPADGAVLRVEPRANAQTRGRLAHGTTASLIALMPRWYETRLPDGETVFASKQSTDVVACPRSISAASAGPIFELHAIDIGTGLAILVRGPDFNLLYDAGTNDDLARGDDNRVVAYLRTFNAPITRLDHVLLSHPHRDHVELLPDVLAKFAVGHVWNSGAYNDICGYRELLKKVAAEPGLQYHTAIQGPGSATVFLTPKTCYGVKGDTAMLTISHAARIDDKPVQLGQGASMNFLYADGSKRHSFNENSLVVRLDLGPHRVLIMGDAEAGGRESPLKDPKPSSIESKLLACCATAPAGEIPPLKSDVLIVGHHGSMTSSRVKFLDAVAARFFIVSSGPTRYASVTLPDADVISQIEARGPVFRTDLDDGHCANEPDKVGSDLDGKPGGCDNVLLTLPVSGEISGGYRSLSD